MSEEQAHDAGEAKPADVASGEAAPEPARPTTKTKARTRKAGASAAESWGFPRFAKEFPRHPELDALVAAFAHGDYATVRERAPKLAASADAEDDVRRAARILRERIEPDPTSRLLFVIAALLLVFLGAWWVAHDGPEGNAPPATKTTPK